MKHDFTFTELIKRRGLDAARTKMVRHDKTGGAKWLEGRAALEDFASVQFVSPNPFLNADYICQFVPIGLAHDAFGALFVGAHKIVGLPVPLMSEEGQRPVQRFQLERLHAFDDLVGRVVIEWSESSSGTRTWYQWPERQPKPIVELRSKEFEEPFPGFAALLIQSDQLSAIPLTWRAALESSKGVYLLVVNSTGKQYVGSATGTGGFLGRWLGYDDGDGGNVGLKNISEKSFTISILEVVSSVMSQSEIVARENLWKAKLGSKVHGHNRN